MSAPDGKDLPGSWPRVAIVILNWRRPDDTIACALSAGELDHENVDIIVCDNDLGDGSYDRILSGLEQSIGDLNAKRAQAGKRAFQLRSDASNPDGLTHAESDPASRRLWIVQTGQNGGYAFGNNVGIRLGLSAADVDFVWVINNDTSLAPDSLSFLLARMRQDPSIGLCGAKILYMEEPGVVQSLGGGRLLKARARCELIGNRTRADAAIDSLAVETSLSYVNGAAVLARRAFIDTVGLMDEGYFLYWEELDWATRGAARFRLGFSPEAIVYHRVGAALGTRDSGESSPMSDFYLTRGRFRYLRLHKPLLLLIAFPLLIKKIAQELATGRTDKVAVLWKAVFGKQNRWVSSNTQPMRRA